MIHCAKSDHDQVTMVGMRSQPKVTGTTAIVAGPKVGVKRRQDAATRSGIRTLGLKRRVASAIKNVMPKAKTKKGKNKKTIIAIAMSVRPNA